MGGKDLICVVKYVGRDAATMKRVLELERTMFLAGLIQEKDTPSSRHTMPWLRS